MSQSKRASWVEALVNTAVGLLVSLLLQVFAVPCITGHRSSLAADCAVVALFTVASVLRGYGLRRLFNFLTEKSHETHHA